METDKKAKDEIRLQEKLDNSIAENHVSEIAGIQQRLDDAREDRQRLSLEAFKRHGQWYREHPRK